MERVALSTTAGPSGRHLAQQVKPRILSLYRRVLRAAREWDENPVERKYILEEAADAFRDSTGITSRQQLESKIENAERRLEIALHYGIAYPRLHHLAQGALFSGKATATQAAEAAEAAAAASASAVVQAPPVFGSQTPQPYVSNPFSDEDEFEPPSVRNR